MIRATIRERPSVVRLDSSLDGWNRGVAAAEDATICHLAGWHDVMSDVLGHEPVYLGELDHTGEWAGLLPMVRVRSRIFGDYLVSMPFLNYGGPIGAPAARRRLLAAAADHARDLGVDLLELRSRVLPADPLPRQLRVAYRKVAVLLPLPDDAEVLWKDVFRSKLRSQIRRPMKEGMEPRFGSDQLEAFYAVFARNMRDLGTPVLPLRFFARIQEIFPDHVLFGAVYRGSDPVAAGCGFRWRDEFEMTWASSLREYNRAAPNMLLYWSFMQRCIHEGLKMFNFGRCTPGGGTHRFKRQWGGEDLDLPWTQWTTGTADATPSPDRPVYRMATRLWSRLPLSVANRLGPGLARRLP